MKEGRLMTIEMQNELRLCKVGDEFGYFHKWDNEEQLVVQPNKISRTRDYELIEKIMNKSIIPADCGVTTIPKIVGIVEFADGVRTVDPHDIVFCDETNQTLKALKEAKHDRNNT